MGNESIAIIRRLLTSIDLFCHGEYYSSQLGKIWDSLDEPKFTSKLSMFKVAFHFKSSDNLVDCNDTRETFRGEAERNCNKNE